MELNSPDDLASEMRRRILRPGDIPARLAIRSANLHSQFASLARVADLARDRDDLPTEAEVLDRLAPSGVSPRLAPVIGSLVTSMRAAYQSMLDTPPDNEIKLPDEGPLEEIILPMMKGTNFDLFGAMGNAMSPLLVLSGEQFGTTDLSLVAALASAFIPDGPAMRQGAFFAAVGEFERHLVNLLSIHRRLVLGEEKTNPKDLNRSLRSRLYAVKNLLAPAFDKSGMLTKDLLAVIEQRNALLHRHGRVDEQYRRLAEASEETLGAFINVDDRFLRECLSLLESSSQRATFVAWAQWHPESVEDRAIVFSGYAAVAYERENWAALLILADAAPYVIEDEEEIARYQVNYWLSVKRLATLSPGLCRRISRWRHPDGAKWDLAAAALLGDTDRVLIYLTTVLSNGEMTVGDVNNAKMLDDYRDTAEFREIVARHSDDGLVR